MSDIRVVLFWADGKIEVRRPDSLPALETKLRVAVPVYRDPVLGIVEADEIEPPNFFKGELPASMVRMHFFRRQEPPLQVNPLHPTMIYVEVP